MRGATDELRELLNTKETSIHAPHAWGDEITAEGGNRTYNFNPRPTCVGRRMWFSLVRLLKTDYFNPRPTCVGRLLNGTD